MLMDGIDESRKQLLAEKEQRGSQGSIFLFEEDRASPGATP